MISISQALHIIIQESPFLEDALYHEYINLSSFAEYIQPRVEKITKKEVTVGSIKMSLSRYTAKQQNNISFKKFYTDDIFVKRNIDILYMQKTQENLKIISSISNTNFGSGGYLSSVNGEREISVIFDSKVGKNISEHIKQKSKKHLRNLALIGVFLEEENINEIGIIYTLTKKLNFSGINMVEIISNYTEVSFIVQEKDLPKALEVLMS